jgi:transposase
VPSIRVKHIPAIKNIPNELWDEIKLLVPSEKPNKIIGRPIIPFRKVLDGIVYVLTTGCHGKCFQKSMALTLFVIDDFKNG